ncbi:hypothetical protein G5714_013003 [Onychostoma macrolepis]|uniref:Uncharacterized protein n=1 Tax=Onychostoma macrolepis TaxID=369639 RepID=A0A7J6CKH9_9TELE|nr:hypothetical protein G5714_013003 [Onychostoma macrolepis]
MGLSKAEELEIIYPAEVKSAKDKKKMKEMILRENPEILLSDYSGPENNRRNFRNLKGEVQKIKKAPEVKSQAEEEAGTTSVTITDPSSRTHGHTSTPASPKIKALRDNIAELEQDFFLFKEETNNNLHHLESSTLQRPNHQQITHQHLYDHIHIHREGMRLFAKTIKASTLNSPQKTHPDREERAGQLPGSDAAVDQTPLTSSRS